MIQYNGWTVIQEMTFPAVNMQDDWTQYLDHPFNEFRLGQPPHNESGLGYLMNEHIYDLRRLLSITLVITFCLLLTSFFALQSIAQNSSQVTPEPGELRVAIDNSLLAGHSQNSVEERIRSEIAVDQPFTICLLYTSPSPRDRG